MQFFFATPQRLHRVHSHFFVIVLGMTEGGFLLPELLAALAVDAVSYTHLDVYKRQDWGLQMGLIIEEVRDRHPELPYFDPDFTGEYPKEAPFTISELEEIYPAASAKSKADEAFAQRAHHATYLLQSGDRGYRAMWEHIMRVSVADLKRNYENLNVSFDVWLGESDADVYKRQQ